MTSSNLLAPFLIFASASFLFVWPLLHRKWQRGRRFELFGFDFAIGASVSSLLTALLFGLTGNEISFTDRMLVSGFLPQVWNTVAGATFGLGNLLFCAGMSLIGLARASLVTFSAALVLLSLTFVEKGDSYALWWVVVLALSACAAATYVNFQTNSPVGSADPMLIALYRRWKGPFLTLGAGVCFAGAYIVSAFTVDPDLGPGPYATTLMLALGTVAGTLAANLFLMNIKVLGAPIRYPPFGWTSLRPALPGFLAGASWSLAVLCFLIASNPVHRTDLAGTFFGFVPASLVLNLFAFGVFHWKELNRTKLLNRILLFTSAGLLIVAFFWTAKSHPMPPLPGPQEELPPPPFHNRAR